MKILKIMLLACFVLALASCGKQEVKPEPTKAPSEFEEVFQPDWYGLQGDEEFVFTYGTAEKVNQNMAYQAAVSNAYLEAANYVETYVKGMVKNYMQEAGVDNPQTTSLTTQAVKQVAKAKFVGTLVSQRKTYKKGDKFVSFVRLSIPKGQINKTLVNSIKNEEALYSEFKASQAFNEMETETEKY